MAAVALAAQQSFAPVVSLYVNDHNRAARAAYERVGFREVGTYEKHARLDGGSGIGVRGQAVGETGGEQRGHCVAR